MFLDVAEAVKSTQMSHFTLESTVSELTRMDAPLERGPLLRWQRKAIEAGLRAASIDGYLSFCVFFICLAVSIEITWRSVTNLDKPGNIYRLMAIFQVENVKPGKCYSYGTQYQ